ncbi:hypothetical protein A2856_02600 [Candidatus Uhrbacteria bacterium RIFCSPHIGHO2_01_FULL_63_20]|uniref:ABC1 atypical kinase-like domain-containing protein n=1 Tax=Candidatus Uhrbacteria bacterium RIFCSPHIGHO2_01_FULL_63_20 TaxID=1802385 RepID=A0A1F7TLY3_9BACT|nr:MAG: hypothetical protein A2856_02600 [Candidatus Uhrbacteria bacterium RIFCSPHIGHO2_01_FULL_63_20]
MAVPHRPRLKRAREVIGVFYDFGFGAWISRMKLHYAVPIHKRWMRMVRRGNDLACPIEAEAMAECADLPQNLRLAFERLGGTYVKLGQMLSLRADLVTQPVADELRKLQDRVPPFPFEQVKASIEKELGKPLTKLFRSFDKKPVGAASLAQVHRAVLPNGKTVAVKVLRPDIEALAREDIALLQWFAKLLEDRIPATRPYQPRRTIEEFREWTLRELNLVNEGVNVEHFRTLYKDDEQVFIPGVHWDHTTARVLTIDFSHGIHMDDFASYGKIRCSRKVVAEIGAKLVYSQFFEHGFFHGDPHPGNFFVLPDNVVCLHDFGIVGHIDEKTRRELIGCFVDFLEKDADGAINHVLHMARTDNRSDMDGFRRDVTVILERWFYSPTAGERLSMAFYRMVVNGASHGVTFPSSVVLLAKAIVTMEGMALLLDPKFDVAEKLRPYLQRIMTLDLKPERLAKRGRDVLLDAANLLEDAPEAARKLMKLAQSEEIGIKVDAMDFDAIKEEIDRQADIKFLTLFLVADLLATAVLLHLEGVERVAGIPFGAAGLVIGTVLGLLVLSKIRQKPS